MPLAAATLGAGVVGALATNSAAKKSAKAAEAANAQSLALQQQMYDRTRSDLQPYMQGGQQALQVLQARLGLGDAGGQGAPNALKTGAYADPAAFSYGLGDYTASPAYQVQLQQGINAINSSAAARGSLNSGATLKALQKYGSDLALQDFSNERNYAASRYDTDRTYNANRYDTQNSNLFNLTELGQNAAGGIAGAGRNYATSASQLFGSDAAAQSSSYGAQAKAIGSILNSGMTFAKDPTVAAALKKWTKPSPYPDPYEVVEV